jgi:hypothetical protein
LHHYDEGKGSCNRRSEAQHGHQGEWPGKVELLLNRQGPEVLEQVQLLATRLGEVGHVHGPIQDRAQITVADSENRSDQGKKNCQCG